MPGSEHKRHSERERCPVCEGLDQPGLIHNPQAPYCSQREDCTDPPADICADPLCPVHGESDHNLIPEGEDVF